MDKLSSAYGGSQSVFADQIKLVWEGWGQEENGYVPHLSDDGQSLINSANRESLVTLFLQKGGDGWGTVTVGISLENGEHGDFTVLLQLPEVVL
jgi:hypothetical protein